MHSPLASMIGTCMLVCGGALLVGCPTPGIGDPCTPESIPVGGFHGDEVSVEVRSLQCRTRICLIYHYLGDPTGTLAPPDPNPSHTIYCTCKCGPGDRCEGQCPEHYLCCSLFSGPGFPEGLAGSYCVYDIGQPGVCDF